MLRLAGHAGESTQVVAIKATEFRYLVRAREEHLFQARESLKQLSEQRTDSLRVLFLTLPSASPLSTFGAVETFTEANALRPSAPMYSVEVVSLETGCRFSPTQALGVTIFEAVDNLPIDTLLVVGGLEVQERPFERRLLDLVRTYSSRARRVVGVSSGTFLLAQARLLTRRRVTTHWIFANRLASAYPEVNLLADRLYVKDDKFYTSAGATSAIDLALALVREDIGSDLANSIARRLLLFVNRSDVHPQVSNVLLAQATEMRALSDLLVWIADNLREDLSVLRLSRRAAMSERNFARQFLREVGTSPGQYVNSLRVNAAMNLLISSRGSLKQIAEATGFGSSASLRRSFHHVCKMTPAQYRSHFKLTLKRESICVGDSCSLAPSNSAEETRVSLRSEGASAMRLCPADTTAKSGLPVCWSA